MSTNEELVLRAEQAAEQVARDKAEIEEIVNRIDTIQITSIEDSKEDIRQALIEKGQSVGTDVPFSKYGDKVRAIESGSGDGGGGGEVSTGDQILVSEDHRWRWFGLDADTEIRDIQPSLPYNFVTYDPYNGSVFGINGGAYKIGGPHDNNDVYGRCTKVVELSNIVYACQTRATIGFYLCSDKKLYRSTDDVLTTDNTVPTTLVDTDVDQFVPSNNAWVWVRKGTDVYVARDDGSFSEATKVEDIQISRIISRRSLNKSDSAVYAINTAGSLVSLYFEEYEGEKTLTTRVLSGPPPGGGEWKDVCFAEDGAMDMGAVGILATSTTGDLYCALPPSEPFFAWESLSWNKVNEIGGIKNLPGYFSTSASMVYDEEEGYEYFVASDYVVGLVVNADGKLYKISANLDSDGWYTGLRVTQIGSDTDWKWAYPTLESNKFCIGQKGNYLVRIIADNNDDLNISYIKVRYIESSMTDAFITAGGNWCAVFRGYASSSGGGGTVEFYKCASVDKTNNTWTGYKAVLSSGVYTFEESATAGLTYGNGFIPKGNEVYSIDALIHVKNLYDGSDPAILLEVSFANSNTTPAKGSIDITGEYEANSDGLFFYEGDIGTDVALEDIADAFTIYCEVKTNNEERLALFAANDSDQKIGIDTNGGTWNIWAGDNGWNILEADSDFEPDEYSSSGRSESYVRYGEFQKIVFTHSGNNWDLYVDGVNVLHRIRDGRIRTGGTLRFNRWGHGGFMGWETTYKTVLVLQRALTADEVAAL